ncbi:hypothetical protein AB205_0004820, partial [Aquarana catesbeiana]
MFLSRSLLKQTSGYNLTTPLKRPFKRNASELCFHNCNYCLSDLDHKRSKNSLCKLWAYAWILSVWEYCLENCLDDENLLTNEDKTTQDPMREHSRINISWREPHRVSGSEDDEKPEVEEPYFVVTSDVHYFQTTWCGEMWDDYQTNLRHFEEMSGSGKFIQPILEMRETQASWEEQDILEDQAEAQEQIGIKEGTEDQSQIQISSNLWAPNPEEESAVPKAIPGPSYDPTYGGHVLILPVRQSQAYAYPGRPGIVAPRQEQRPAYRSTGRPTIVAPRHAQMRAPNSEEESAVPESIPGPSSAPADMGGPAKMRQRQAPVSQPDISECL